MKIKQPKDNKQFSLMLDQAVNSPEPKTVPSARAIRDNVIEMPTAQDALRSFRERIIQDLLKNRVMVAE